jgi:CheY-like chemotaxis protein
MLRFLWLEDQPATKPTVLEGLEWEFGCTIEFATSSTEMISKLRSTNFDLLLLDLRLPEDDNGDHNTREIDSDYGFSALLQFNEGYNSEFATPRDIPVLVLSARFDPEARTRAAEFVSIRGYVSKPLRFERLTHEIRRALQVQ